MKKVFGAILILWVVSLLTSAYIAPRFIPDTLFIGSRNSFDERLPQWLYDNRMPRWIWMWANLDGNHYLSIARNGYYEFENGFFPLYPLAIRVVANLSGLPFLLSGLLVTYTSFILFLKLLLRLLRLDFTDQASNQVIRWIIGFPVAFYLIAIYNDALFLFLTVGCFYAVRKSKWWPGGILGGLAALTRFPGIAIFPALLIEWWSGKRRIRDLIPVFFIPLSTLSYFLYLHIWERDWNLFVTSMSVWRQDRFVLPIQTAYRYFKIFASVSPNSLMYFLALAEFSAVVFAIVVLIKGFKLIRRSYWVYAVSYLLIPMSGGTFQGMPRYIIHAFPVILIFSLLTVKSRWRYLVMGGFFVLQLIFMAFFSQGYFIS
ncbi:hypothetical protein HYU89_03170 [Candidatus Collierbacteria bacterium]|nr:hypothetical protein [Candidatus Collierbacteria bacterium]